MPTHKPTSATPSAPTLQGLVISYFGNSVAVEAQGGQVFQCHLRKNQPLPVVGDQVTFVLGNDQSGVISAILPRHSMLARGDERQAKQKPIAANIDAMVIVMSPPPIFSEYLIDRYLVAAELLSIPAMLVLNKIDLVGEQHQQAVDKLLMAYRSIPYTVVASSVLLPEGLTVLAEALKDKTAVLVGPSGVGKSSIISTLGQHADIVVGETTGKGIGKHTTTATRLYHLPKGGCLIDSPGVREFNLWPITPAALLRGFKEFKAHATGCKFRDCLHYKEPGCAVQAAVASGKIGASRFANYQELMNTIATLKS